MYILNKLSGILASVLILYSSCLFAFDPLIANSEQGCDDLSILFTPVREEFVDELPEDIRQLPMTSMLPVVYRGAAKNWDSMKWTRESLDKMGFRSGSNSKSVYISEVLVKKTGERKVTDKKLSDLLDKDTRYREDFIYSPEFHPETSQSQPFMYFLFIGRAGESQILFDFHEGTLLSEFYGEKLVLLMSPGISSDETAEFTSCITKSLKKYTSEGMTMSEAAMKIIDNKDSDQLIKHSESAYSPAQRIILKPGDVLYIPAMWAHRVFYLKNSIGAAQQIMKDNVNLGFD